MLDEIVRSQLACGDKSPYTDSGFIVAIVPIVPIVPIVTIQRKIYQVVIAAGSHLFPFRTEKLSPLAPMVLQCNAGE